MGIPLDPSALRSPIGRLATERAGASRVFYRHHLDFCCGGHVTLEQACERAGLSPTSILEEIHSEETRPQPFERWDQKPLAELLDHLLTNFHEPHRRELPRLVEMSQKVESVHALKPDCPRGLAEHLQQMHAELEQHMLKEEDILFPMIRQGHGAMAAMPIQVMEEEHRDHAKNLERLRALASGFTAPEEACNTWRALYLGLAELEAMLMEHIHLENHVLFPRALAGR